MLVPIKEMTDVLSVESKSVDLARDTWVRMKIGIYKGDLAKVLLFLFWLSSFCFSYLLSILTKAVLCRLLMLTMCARE